MLRQFLAHSKCSINVFITTVIIILTLLLSPIDSPLESSMELLKTTVGDSAFNTTFSHSALPVEGFESKSNKKTQQTSLRAVFCKGYLIIWLTSSLSNRRGLFRCRASFDDVWQLCPLNPCWGTARCLAGCRFRPPLYGLARVLPPLQRLHTPILAFPELGLCRRHPYPLDYCRPEG